MNGWITTGASCSDHDCGSGAINGEKKVSVYIVCVGGGLLITRESSWSGGRSGRVQTRVLSGRVPGRSGRVHTRVLSERVLGRGGSIQMSWRVPRRSGRVQTRVLSESLPGRSERV